MQIFFSSDFHLGHDNIRRYCQRPFTDLKHMDTTIINNFNQRVGIDDFCFFLGDFCFTRCSEAPNSEKNAFQYYREQLKCKNIIFVAGNHDNHNKNKSVIESMVINYGGFRIYMTHNPKYAKPDFKFNLCGHVHEKWQFQKLGDKSTIVNLSVEQWKYAPVTIGEIQAAYSRWIKSEIKQ